jgi:hypothetical protein
MDREPWTCRGTPWRASSLDDSADGPGPGGWETERCFTSKATMFFRINRYENDCVPIADSSEVGPVADERRMAEGQVSRWASQVRRQVSLPIADSGQAGPAAEAPEEVSRTARPVSRPP